MNRFTLLLFSLTAGFFVGQDGPRAEMKSMKDKNVTMARLEDHVRALTVDMGERSVRRPENLAASKKDRKSFFSVPFSSFDMSLLSCYH